MGHMPCTLVLLPAVGIPPPAASVLLHPAIYPKTKARAEPANAAAQRAPAMSPLSALALTMICGAARPGVLVLLLLLGTLTGGAHAQNSGNMQQPSGPNTSLAMIILYAITGCVSALFCVVIVSGAIRAIRHPERYGPRAGDAGYGGGAAQSRARGLTRAILDTFPVVKFGGDPNAPAARAKDVEHAAGDIELGECAPPRDDAPDASEKSSMHAADSAEGPGGARASQFVSTAHAQDGAPPGEQDLGEGGALDSPGAGSSAADAAPAARPRPRPGRSASGALQDEEKKEVVPDAIGTETCPICILDFEEGDDLRVLPCAGQHRFHRDCVDQWLLELSSSCPICRQDFHALEVMMAQDAGESLEPPHAPGAMRPLSTAAARFSRYLRSARRRHNRNREDGYGYDVTDPPMPLSPEIRPF